MRLFFGPPLTLSDTVCVENAADFLCAVAKHPRSSERLSSVKHDDAGMGEGPFPRKRNGAGQLGRSVCRRQRSQLPNVRYWANSGRHILNSSSSGFDPNRTSGVRSITRFRALAGRQTILIA